MQEQEINPSFEKQNPESKSPLENLQVLAEQSLKKIEEIKETAQQQLHEIRKQMKLIDKKSKRYGELKQNEDFYNAALAESSLLQQSILQKSELLNSHHGEKLNAHEMVVKINLKNPPYESSVTQDKITRSQVELSADLALIKQLRGMNPNQNFYLHENQSDTLHILETEIILTDSQKICGLRVGVSTQMQIRQNYNQRSERQLPHDKRQRVMTRKRERGSRTR